MDIVSFSEASVVSAEGQAIGYIGNASAGFDATTSILPFLYYTALIKERAGAEKLKLGIERLEDVLRKTGGAHYPKTALVENVEFFLVAAIVILGIRTYFVQPFKIPTNSMWPTYNGMTSEVFKSKADEPNVAAISGSP